MTAKSTDSEKALRGITVGGEPLINVLEEEEKKKDAEELGRGEKHFLLKRPYERYKEQKLRDGKGRSLGRMGVMREHFGRVIKEMLMNEATTKTHLVAAALLKGEITTAIRIAMEIERDAGEKVARGDVTSILARLSKSPAARYIAVDRSKKPYRYKVLDEACECLSPTDLVNLYNSRHPLTHRDLEKRCPNLKGLKAPSYVQPGSTDDADLYLEAGGTPGEDVNAEPSAPGRVGPILSDSARDVNVHISFGPIRILFGLDKTMLAEKEEDDG